MRAGKPQVRVPLQSWPLPCVGAQSQAESSLRSQGPGSAPSTFRLFFCNVGLESREASSRFWNSETPNVPVTGRS